MLPSIIISNNLNKNCVLINVMVIKHLHAANLPSQAIYFTYEDILTILINYANLLIL